MSAPRSLSLEPFVPSLPKKDEQEWAPICTENPQPHVPDGEYTAFCLKASKYRNPRFKREEIALHFTLCECESEGTKLMRYFLAETAGKTRSNYYREWVIANNGVAPFRGDRMPIKKFKGKLFKVRVATVLLDAQQEKRPPATQYSKVSAILELLTTNESSN